MPQWTEINTIYVYILNMYLYLSRWRSRSEGPGTASRSVRGLQFSTEEFPVIQKIQRRLGHLRYSSLEAVVRSLGHPISRFVSSLWSFRCGQKITRLYINICTQTQRILLLCRPINSKIVHSSFFLQKALGTTTFGSFIYSASVVFLPFFLNL